MLLEREAGGTQFEHGPLLPSYKPLAVLRADLHGPIRRREAADRALTLLLPSLRSGHASIDHSLRMDRMVRVCRHVPGQIAVSHMRQRRVPVDQRIKSHPRP